MHLHTPSQARDALLPTAASFRGAANHPPATLGRLGALEVRLATTPAEIAAAQELRYQVFFEELSAKAGDVAGVNRRDADRFDAACDHLLVFDTSSKGDGPGEGGVVGTYRLLQQDRALAAGGFYSQDEFQLRGLTARHPGLRFLELGRSCVLPRYRSKRTIEVLWQGIWAYVRRHGVDALIGCASFPGVVPAAHAHPLSYLAHFRRAAPVWDASALPHRFCRLDWMPAEAVDARRATAAMPPLIKAYLRVGARVGDGCVIDEDFGTTDVLMVMPVAEIDARYINHYSGEADRRAA